MEKNNNNQKYKNRPIGTYQGTYRMHRNELKKTNSQTKKPETKELAKNRTTMHTK